MDMWRSEDESAFRAQRKPFKAESATVPEGGRVLRMLHIPETLAAMFDSNLRVSEIVTAWTGD